MQPHEMTTKHLENRIKWLERMRARELDAMNAMVDMADTDGDMGHSMSISREFYAAEINEGFGEMIEKLKRELAARSLTPAKE